MASKFEQLREKLNELKVLGHIGALLDWDQQVNLPPAAGAGRTEQVEYVASAVHQRLTSDSLLELTQSCEREPLDHDQRLVVSELARTIQKQRRLPPEFVAKSARATSEMFQAWQVAKPAGDWKGVQGRFSEVVKIYREEGERLADGATPYDALLDKYERGAKVAQLKPLFVRLADKLSALVKILKERNTVVPPFSIPVEVQAKVNNRIARLIGYDFSRGALHTAAHPFMTSLGADDFRITTRYFPENPLSTVYSTLHEVGHALYEQGLPAEWCGTARGQSISLGVHESQSRFWENMIGRRATFMPHLARAYHEEGVTRTEAQLWSEANRVNPSFIRVEADEVTYSLHVVIRLMLEEALISGDLSVTDLPGAWNDAYERYLGIQPATPTLGVLQDVHWYCGLIGYFPTYVLGNLYGGMILNALEKEGGSVDPLVAAGEFAPILGWLRRNIHTHGMKYGALELVEGLAKENFSEKPFLTYLSSKFGVAESSFQ